MLFVFISTNSNAPSAICYNHNDMSFLLVWKVYEFRRFLGMCVSDDAAAVVVNASWIYDRWCGVKPGLEEAWRFMV